MPELILIPLAALGLAAMWWIFTYNKFKSLNLQTEAAISNIDVALAKRYDTLTNMVEVVKGYVKHEELVLTKITQIRSDSIREMAQSNARLDAEKLQLLKLIEAYPELKADRNFLHLQKVIADTEEHLQAARRLYNQSVKMFNTALEIYPSNIVGRSMNLRRKEFFQSDDEQRKSVNIEF